MIGRLATTTASGDPHVVPCCFALLDGILYSAVDSKPKSTQRLKRLANIEANPRTAFLVDNYEDDWTKLWWVRVDGTARLVEDHPERNVALSSLAAKYRQYIDQPPTGPVLAIDIESWASWP